MKKILFATGLSLLLTTGFCSCDNNSDDQLTDAEIQEILVGKWERTQINGRRNVTDYGIVFTLNADMTGTISASQENGDFWLSKEPLTCTVKDAVLTLSVTNFPQITNCFKLTKVEDDKICATETAYNGKDYEVVFERVNADYKTAILGLWEGVSMDGPATYGDYTHRWEYKADGTYVYYSKDGDGNWEPFIDDVRNEYNVDGTWLSCLWEDTTGTVYRERWDITVCDEENMVWSAYRRDRDTKEYFDATYTMKKIK